MEVKKLYGSGLNENRTVAHQNIKTEQHARYARPNETFKEAGIDLNELLISNKPATFFLKVTGKSMINAGIDDGDTLIVDRSIKPQSGKIVIAVIDGEMLIRRYQKTINKLRLVPETPKLSPIEVSEFSDCIIWGVVVCVIRTTP